MKKNLFLSVLVVVLLSSCYSTKVVAPASGTVKLATEMEPLPIKLKKANWYVLWGAVPINPNKTDKVIAEANLKKVRVETKFTFLDYVINFFTGSVTVKRTTSIIEGDIKE